MSTNPTTGDVTCNQAHELLMEVSSKLSSKPIKFKTHFDTARVAAIKRRIKELRA